MIDDKEVLEMALVGYRHRISELSKKVTEIEIKLRVDSAPQPITWIKSQQARLAAKRRAA